MPVAVGDVTRVVAKMSDADNSIIQNTFYVHNSGLAPVDDAVVTAALEAKLSATYTLVEGYIPITCNPVEIECDQVGFVSGRIITLRPVGVEPWITWAGGTGTGNEAPSFVTAVVGFPTQIPRVQGRKSVGPLTTVGLDGNNLAGGLFLGMVNFGLQLIGTFPVGGEDFEFGVMSTKAAVFVSPTGYVVKNVVGHQNTRKVGVGI